jgi:predicted CXXCH cytochrome family protein
MWKYAVATLAPVLLALFAPVAGGDIVGSEHDFSGEGWSEEEICKVCHTPHEANLAAAAPLWNHDVTSATFTLYTSDFLVETPEPPRGVTLMCLSCHDGTIAVDSFGGASGTHFVTGTGQVGTDLSDDHPVSIKWTHQTDVGNCGNCHFAHGQIYSSELPFFEGYVECATCHDVHDGSGHRSMLRLSPDGSELCLYCHHK